MPRRGLPDLLAELGPGHLMVLHAIEVEAGLGVVELHGVHVVALVARRACPPGGGDVHGLAGRSGVQRGGDHGPAVDLLHDVQLAPDGPDGVPAVPDRGTHHPEGGPVARASARVDIRQAQQALHPECPAGWRREVRAHRLDPARGPHPVAEHGGDGEMAGPVQGDVRRRFRHLGDLAGSPVGGRASGITGAEVEVPVRGRRPRAGGAVEVVPEDLGPSIGHHGRWGGGRLRAPGNQRRPGDQRASRDEHRTEPAQPPHRSTPKLTSVRSIRAASSVAAVFVR